MRVRISVDLRSKLGKARDQGPRPTCMAFAASDGHSFAHSSFEDLSAEYAHYHAIRRMPIFNPNQGVSLATMVDVLREDGQPLENGWPYREVVPTPLSTWKPPINPGKIFRHAFVKKPSSASEVFDSLERGHVALLVLRISKQFHTPPSDHVIGITPGDSDTAIHALLGVGLGEIKSSRVGLMRNSWGKDWGDEGHIWVTEEYLSLRLCSVAVPF